MYSTENVTGKRSVMVCVSGCFVIFGGASFTVSFALLDITTPAALVIIHLNSSPLSDSWTFSIV